MKNVVIDASVAVKWFLRQAEDEDHVPEAVAVLRRIGDRTLQPIQPPHWLAEVAAVLARRYPQAAQPGIELLVAMDIPIMTGLACYQRALFLSQNLDHHLFDTLYHATALETGATLITADRHYWRKAGGLGHIALLHVFDLP